MRAVIEVSKDLNIDELKDLALKQQNVIKFLDQPPTKTIIIPNRIVNFVT